MILDDDLTVYAESELDLDGDSPLWTDGEYQDWDPATSRMISGPLGAAKFPGRRFDSWQEARAYVTSKYQVIKFGCVPGRWLARIRRTQ